MLEWMSVQHLIWASPTFPAQKKTSSPSGLSGNGILVITGSPIHHWITPALVLKREVGTSQHTMEGGTSKADFHWNILSFRPFDPSQKCSEWVNHSQSVQCPPRPEAFKTEALDWWWYSGFCQGSPKVFVPVSSETLHFDAKSTDSQDKGGKKHVTENLFRKTPTSCIGSFPAALHFSNDFSMKVFFQPLPGPVFPYHFLFLFPAAGRVGFFSGQLRWYDSWHWRVGIESWRPYQNTTPPEV